MPLVKMTIPLGQLEHFNQVGWLVGTLCQFKTFQWIIGGMVAL
jgi:hypothetical protein